MGGGIDEGESIEEGLKRECLEEAGVEIDIISKLCKVKEIQKYEEQIQNSYCYVAQVKGEKGKSYFTKNELAAGFETQWVELDTLIQEITTKGYENILGEYVVKRSLYILEEYKKTLK